MSYDVTIGKRFSANYTSNVGPLFHAHIRNYETGDTGLQVLHGVTGRTALIVLSRAFDSINREYCRIDNIDTFRSQYDAPNKWGSTDGALMFLARVMAACAENPRCKVDVSA